MKVRIARRTEPYVKGTMVTLQYGGEIILRENKTSKRRKIEDDIEEILTHEIIHIVIFKLMRDEIIAQSIDNLCIWIMDCELNTAHLAFINKKTKDRIYQTPT